MVPLYSFSGNSEEIYLFPNATGKSGSDSNLSVRLCEIEDSELEDFQPLQGRYSSEWHIKCIKQ